MPLLFQFVIIAKMLVFYIFKIFALVIFGIIFVNMLGAASQPTLQADYAYVYSVLFWLSIDFAKFLLIRLVII